MKEELQSLDRSFVVKARGGGGDDDDATTTETGCGEEENERRCGTAAWLARSWQPRGAR